MADEPDEPRKFYTLKPKNFERVNRPSHEEPSKAIDVHAMLNENLAAEPLPAVTPAPLSPQREFSKSSDPQAPVLKPAPVVSGRKKDFWTTIAAVGFVFAIPAFLFRQSDLVLIGTASGFVLVTLVLTWIFWGIMDRY